MGEIAAVGEARLHVTQRGAGLLRNSNTDYTDLGTDYTEKYMGASRQAA
jgi:hypothetical protein